MMTASSKTPAEKAEAARTALRSWRRRRDATDAERDTLVVTALDAGLIKEEVHVITGLGRTTIDRIAARAAPAEPEGTTLNGEGGPPWA
jgi:hypothetical protein